MTDQQQHLQPCVSCGRELKTVILLSELVGHFNATATNESPIQCALEDFAQRCEELRKELLTVGTKPRSSNGLVQGIVPHESRRNV